MLNDRPDLMLLQLREEKSNASVLDKATETLGKRTEYSVPLQPHLTITDRERMRMLPPVTSVITRCRKSVGSSLEINTRADADE
jgi:hypothetical protein